MRTCRFKFSLVPWCLGVSLAGACAGAFAHEANKDAATDTVITPVAAHPLPEFGNKEAVMLTVEYAPGASTPPHKHAGHTFVYILEGAIETQVAGGELVRLTAGESFYETPTDVHTVSRNASKTERAKFLVFFLQDKGAQVLELVK